MKRILFGITANTLLFALFFLLPFTGIAQEGPRPCLTGTIIIGEGDHAGKIELQGFPFTQYIDKGPNHRPGKRTLSCRSGFSGNIVINETNGRYKLPDGTFPGYKPYLVIKGDSPPMILLRKDGGGMKFTIGPVYRVTENYLRNGSEPRFKVVTRMKGQTIGEGRCYSTIPAETQKRTILTKQEGTP